ncbi:MAG: NAD(P)H-hydrate dehydratase [Candidatus Woesearchaeota archaeon]|nr:NAD(P)H-hydrate dehydratase [Candidatus Woesearchaeota archaeon]
MKIKRKEIKGQNGKVLVVGGSKDYIGAPAFSAMAALRTGVDIVTVCAPEKVAWAINGYSPDLITKKFLGDELNLVHAKEIISLSETHDVVLLGPGLGLKKDFVLKLIREIKKPFVIDADALKVISIEVASKSILTPHRKEFEILYSNSIKKPYDLNIDQNIKEMQQKIGDNVILLKGQTDYVITKTKVQQSRTGNNSMTKGGTGDILAGLCAGYLAQTGDLAGSAAHCAYLNGRLGEYMLKWKGYGYTSFDMVNEIWRFTK